MERIVQQRVGVPVACFGNDDFAHDRDRRPTVGSQSNRRNGVQYFQPSPPSRPGHDYLRFAANQPRQAGHTPRSHGSRKARRRRESRLYSLQRGPSRREQENVRGSQRRVRPQRERQSAWVHAYAEGGG
jgi:hypothetical protein